MSTRANVIIIDKFGDELIFYRHSDGYPDGTLPTLNEFLDLVKSGTIRDNVEQASGHLILIGNKEYGKNTIDHWKVGAYEPSVGIHGDIEYLYVIDLEQKKIFIDNKDGFLYCGKYSF